MEPELFGMVVLQEVEPSLSGIQ
jgi:hypothetical protein